MLPTTLAPPWRAVFFAHRGLPTLQHLIKVGGVRSTHTSRSSSPRGRWWQWLTGANTTHFVLPSQLGAPRRMQGDGCPMPAQLLSLPLTTLGKANLIARVTDCHLHGYVSPVGAGKCLISLWLYPQHLEECLPPSRSPGNTGWAKVGLQLCAGNTQS